MEYNQSLGEKLKASKTKEEEDKMFAMRMKLQQEARDAEERIQCVTTFFENAKRQFIIDIESGKPRVQIVKLSSRKEPKAYDILKVYNWNDPKNAIMNKTHPYNPIWAEFEAWCLSNGLKPKMEYAYDGGGVESWYELSVDVA